MSEPVLINRKTYRDRVRYDVINGVRTGPFVDGANIELTRWYKKTLPVDTPGFQELKRKGLRLPVNSYALYLERCTMPQGYPHLKLIYTPNGNYSEYYGPELNGFGNVTYLEPTTAQRQAALSRLKMRCLEKIKGQKVHLGNFIAEREQMFRMFTETASKIVRGAAAVKKGQFKKACQILGAGYSSNGKKSKPFSWGGKSQGGFSVKKTFADNWLQLQYGWLPLYSDLYGACEEVEQTFEILRQEIKGGGGIQYVVAKTRLSDADKYIDPQRPGAWSLRNYIWDLRVKMCYTVDVESAAFLGRIGLTNPLSIAWEVTPFSFVFDWFLPIGRYLNTLDATLGCTFVDGSNAGFLYTDIEYFRDISYVSTPNFLSIYKNCTGRARWFAYERQPLSGFPSWIDFPVPKNPISAAHAANAFALLTQLGRSNR